MKVRILSMCLFIAFSIMGYAQKSISDALPERLFSQGKEMFLDKNYVGAQNMLSEYKLTGKDKNLISEADYMIAVSDYFRGKENTIEVLHDYLEAYPETYHRNDIDFYIGSYFFGDKDWAKALFWFNQVDVNYLSYADQEDYTFRLAYANLQKGNLKVASQKFEILAKNSNKYFTTATYYIAYIDFQEGRYDKALNVFERLKNNLEYTEQSLFFITQGLFLKNDLSGAVNAADSYLQKYPNNKNSAEVYRILGNCYFRQNNIRGAITNYEKYLSLENKPFREDMFQLGTAYTQLGEYSKAIHALQFVASKDDQLGQAAYMMLGQDYLKIGDNANALMSFDAASRVQFDPSISEVALYNYAMLVHKTSLSVFDQSITVLQRFLKEYPNSKYVNEINNQLASTLLSTSNYQAALGVINGMRSPAKQILEAKQTILFQLGVQDFIDGNNNQAIKRFDEAIGLGNYDSKSKNEAYFWRAESYYRLGNYQMASKDYQTYISLSNSSSENYSDAFYNLGYSFFNMKQYSEALNSFKQYSTVEKNRQKLTYSDALNRMGDCYLYNRNFTEAERVYSQAAQSNNQGAEYADFQKAFVLGLQRNYAGKISALDAMMRRYPNSQYVDDALYEKARALVMLGREQDATQVLNTLLKNQPNSNIAPKAGVLLGQSYYNINKTTEAIGAYKNVVNSYRNTEEGRMAIQDLEGIYRDINDIPSYANYVNSLGVGVVITASRQDSLTYLSAENVYMKGQSNDAVKAMVNYLQSYPKGQFAGDAHFYIGEIAYNKKDYNTALAEFNHTINSVNPKNLNKALSYVGAIQLDADNFQSAYDAYKKLERVAISTEDKAVAQSGILKTANKLGNSQEVVTVATELLGNGKTSPELKNEALLYRAKAYLDSNESSKAITDLQKVSADTRNVYGAEAQYLLANTYYNAKSFDKAEAQVMSFMKQNTPHSYWMARAIIVLSDTYVAKGDKFQAKQYLESVKDNYTGGDLDVINMINGRLEALK